MTENLSVYILFLASDFSYSKLPYFLALKSPSVKIVHTGGSIYNVFQNMKGVLLIPYKAYTKHCLLSMHQSPIHTVHRVFYPWVISSRPSAEELTSKAGFSLFPEQTTLGVCVSGDKLLKLLISPFIHFTFIVS